MLNRITTNAAMIAIVKEMYIGSLTFSVYVITKRIAANIHATQKIYIHNVVSVTLKVGESPI